MIYSIGNILINITADTGSFNTECAADIAKQINRKPDSVMGFATGGTPVGTYNELVQLYKSGKVDFSGVTSFNLDEYYPIKRTDSQSYYSFMSEHLFSLVNIKPEHINIPDGETGNAAGECLEYERKIKAAGNIDYQILGIGTNGHIGFNEPDSKFPGSTHLVTLKESTIKDNARFFANPEEVPKNAITMGIKTIMSAKKILLMASGSSKARIIKEALFGEITPSVPASALQLHPNVLVILDNLSATDILPLLN